MNYTGLTVGNKNFIKRFSHFRRFKLTSEFVSKYNSNKVLDYGAGDGELFKYIKRSKRKNFYFFEPNILMVKQLRKNLKKYKVNKVFINSSKIFKNYFDLIFINEVFEHVNIKEQKKIIKNLRKISIKNSTFVISVPIEVGISSLLKNFIRIISSQTHKNTNLENIIKSLFYIKINRSSKKYNSSHIGFDYIKFLKFLKKENFKILKVHYSPFNFLKGLINSQIFIIAKI